MDVYTQSSSPRMIRGARVDRQRTVVRPRLRNAGRGCRAEKWQRGGVVVRSDLVHREYLRGRRGFLRPARLDAKRLWSRDRIGVRGGSIATGREVVLPTLTIRPSSGNLSEFPK